VVVTTAEDSDTRRSAERCRLQSAIAVNGLLQEAEMSPVTDDPMAPA
jgi:hypothetical protein